MLVVDNSARIIEEDYDVIVWDRQLGCVVGFYQFDDDGNISGWVEHGPQELSISGENPKQLAQDTTRGCQLVVKELIQDVHVIREAKIVADELTT